MEIFSTLLALCVENSPVICEFPAQRAVAWSFDDFFDLRLNKRLSKQSRDLRCHQAHYDVTVMKALLLAECQAITWININLKSISPSREKFSEILNQIQQLSVKTSGNVVSNLVEASVCCWRPIALVGTSGTELKPRSCLPAGHTDL